MAAYIKDYSYKKEDRDAAAIKVDERKILDTRVIAQTITMEGIAPFLGILLMAIGLIYTVVGLVKSFNLGSFLIGLFLLSFSTVCIFSLKRIAYNSQQKKIRIYRDYLIFKLGKWSSLQEYNSVKVSVLQTVEAPYSMEETHANLRKISSIYFNVYLSSAGKARLPLFGFAKREEAIDFQNKISKIIGIEAHPEIIRVVKKVFQSVQ